MMRAFPEGRPPESFDALAADLARFQAAHVAGYGRLCAARGVVPSRIARAADAPAVPTDAFKASHVFAFEESGASAAFRTSGTTLGARGVHFFRDLGTYDLGSVTFARGLLLPSARAPTPVLVLGPSPADARDSSLAHMCGLFAVAFGGGETGAGAFFVGQGALDTSGFRARVQHLDAAVPALVLATSFALVHLLDALGGASVPLPAGSRVMQTGGYKGKSREVAPDTLSHDVARAFAIDPRDIVGEYGMTELSSQFWQREAGPGEGRRRVYVEPPWARVVPVSPQTLEPVPEGEAGVARIEDLANVDSAFAVVAQDMVRRVASGFELLGRAPGAAPRGCSIALDEMLSAGAPRPFEGA
jgi:hypothetical protein